MIAINGISTLFSAAMIMTGVPFPITWKLIDFSQLYSLYYYSGAPDFQRHQDLYEALRIDNLAPIFPNPIGEEYIEMINGTEYVSI